MYIYDAVDKTLVRERIDEFRNQVERRLTGALSEDEFKPLRLMNGLYLQLHAYMLRVAIPYGVLSAAQLRKLAEIARVYDRGYGHFTTRQNIQFNWPALVDTPKILEALADVDMHALQTSGNCIRNITTDPYAGAAADEIDDPRPWCEIIRQWSTLHPEFSYLPRKFKIAVSAAATDRAAILAHDIGLRLVRDDMGALGFQVYVGGGLGRTPVLASLIRDFLPAEDLIAYLEAIMRVYNRLGRRDNIYKARVKILVREEGEARFAALVEEEWRKGRDATLALPIERIEAIRAYFEAELFDLPSDEALLERRAAEDADFARWLRVQTRPHRAAGYAIVDISLKPVGGVPGDATAQQMDAIAAIAERFSRDEARVTQQQNLVLPHVRRVDLVDVYEALKAAGLATSNVNLGGDITACPGLDYCDLANARSIPIAQRLSEYFANSAYADDIGELQINISGCINACGRHHVGHIGILGVDRKGEEFYQVTLGGDASERAAIGEIAGRGFSAEDVAPAIARLLDRYREERMAGERFIDCYRRLGPAPFREALYADAEAR
jgi:sulfite reductase (NADPH) hemoprotein beta-component